MNESAITGSAETQSRPRAMLVGMLLLLVIVLTWLPDIDAAAQDYLAATISDNLVIFATARIINSLISVIQSIEISFSLGAGIAVHLGEALDPLNDLIERFSGFVLYGLSSLALQQIILVASASLVMKITTTLALITGYLCWLVGRLPEKLKTILILVAVARFAFPIEVGLAWTLDELYFNAQQQEAVSTLDIAKNRLASIKQEYLNSIEGKGIFESAWQAARNIVDTENEEGITHLAATAVIQLIVIMLIRSTLLPLVYLWLLYVVFSSTLRR